MTSNANPDLTKRIITRAIKTTFVPTIKAVYGVTVNGDITRYTSESCMN